MKIIIVIYSFPIMLEQNNEHPVNTNYLMENINTTTYVYDDTLQPNIIFSYVNVHHTRY